MAAADPTVHGYLVDSGQNEPMVGATIVATRAVGEDVAISDDNGAFQVQVAPAATTTLTVYYNDASFERVVVVGAGVTDVDAGRIAFVVPPIKSEGGFVCTCKSPMIDINTALETSAQTWPTSRARDSASIAMLAAGAPRGQATWLDGNRRLGGSPAIALALLDEVDVYTMRGTHDLDGASDGVMARTADGTNDNHGTARIALGTDGPELEAATGGPIAVDSAWWWAGAVLGPDGQQELAKVTYAASVEEQGNVVALHQSEPAIPSNARAIALGDTSDDYGAARWVSKLDDAKLQLEGGATGERLDDGTLTTRGAIHARIEDRFKLEGYHDLRSFAEVGGGDASGTPHHDASASLTDNWQLVPNVVIDAGARWDERWFGAAHADVWQPHASIGYDWTDEGRSQVFVTADRASLLDAGAIGGWLTTPQWRDDIAAGASYAFDDEDWLVTVAVRTSELADAWRTGVDVAFDHRGRVDLHVVASSVERAIAGSAGLKLAAIRAGVSGRWAADADDIYGSQAGAFATWHRAISKGMATDIGAEAVADREGKLARVVVGFAY